MPPVAVSAALRQAVGDFYGNSLRFVVLNVALAGALVAVLVVALVTPLAAVLGVALGPLAAAVMYSGAKLVQEEEFRLADALAGLRLCWRRGLALGAVGVAFAVATVFAVPFYFRSGGLALPLGVLALYLAALFGIFQLQLWPRAVSELDRPFAAVAREAALAVLRRPAASTGLAVALLLVNLAGVVAAVVPFLTLTIAYSFLAAARFALPPVPLPEARH